jgi:uncharacterized membrane protein
LLCLNIIPYIFRKMVNDTTLAIVALVAALGLLGVVVVDSINVPQQQAFAKGCPLSTPAADASKTHCVHP